MYRRVATRLPLFVDVVLLLLPASSQNSRHLEKLDLALHQALEGQPQAGVRGVGDW